MAVTIKDIITGLDQEAPFNLAEDWDNVGLLVGNPDQEIRSVLVGLDATNTLVDEAIARGCDTILTHHPVIFRPLPSINTAIPEGKILEKALSHRISIIACHTNLDSASEGVSDILATSLGLSNLTPLVPKSECGEEACGLGRIGVYAQPVEIAEFINRALTVLDLTTLNVAGPLPEKVCKVAVCGGSCSDFTEIAFNSGVDIFLTSEVKHNFARWAEERDFCLIDGTHYGTEKAAIQLLAQKISRLADANNWSIEILQTETEKNPLVSLHKDNLKKE